uniref:Uncharacterized protein n=1 Tax=Panagrellus redivivus TaxID=6233 RepID=A0A7E4ZZJ2_PANRE
MFRPQYPDIVEPRYMVCRCLHVRKFASFLILINILLATVAFVLTLSIQHYYNMLLCICYIIVSSLVLAADKLERPSFYTLFLVIQGIFLVIQLVAWIILVMFVTKKYCQKSLNDEGPDDCLASVELAQIITISFFITGCTWNAVYDARRYMVEKVYSGNFKLNTTLAVL